MLSFTVTFQILRTLLWHTGTWYERVNVILLQTKQNKTRKYAKKQENKGGSRITCDDNKATITKVFCAPEKEQALCTSTTSKGIYSSIHAFLWNS